MKNKYPELKFIMNLTDEEIDKVLDLSDKLAGLKGHVIYNTIMAAGLSEQELKLAFFFWGLVTGMQLIEDGYQDEEI